MPVFNKFDKANFCHSVCIREEPVDKLWHLSRLYHGGFILFGILVKGLSSGSYLKGCVLFSYYRI